MMRYWFEFDFTNYDKVPSGLLMGCGVTGYGYEDVINILKEKVFINKSLPEIKKVAENIDLQELDQNHVLPNINSPNQRGVWFPLGYN
ncbi:hypothetical protein DCC81_21335 [Chitinophaga parva]|uniref:Uncharacterized protein n=1 Tax=Chitinophaga parva TaxID=2169414 RepID=A0A2T7BCZ3_9BACT|nr:hypothetical protein [Chitinophaga parva]PUZ22961.1 hypothetical protein DCC81_21335 [Chitinophaga parva]